MKAKHNEREVEQWLDAALAQFSNAEPRSGLEGRVLAHLRKEKDHLEKDRLAALRRWTWAAGTITVAAVLLIVMWVRLRDTRNDPSRTAATPTTHREEAATSRPASHQSPVTEHTQAVVRSPRRQLTSAVATHAKEPKLDQFPSPVPLNDQENRLALYVREFPERAALVARAQTQLRKQEEREMAGPPSETMGATSSDQPE